MRRNVGKKIALRVARFQHVACETLGLPSWPPTDTGVLQELGMDCDEFVQMLQQRVKASDEHTKQLSQKHADHIKFVQRMHADELAQQRQTLLDEIAHEQQSAGTQLKIAGRASKLDYGRMQKVLIQHGISSTYDLIVGRA